MKKVLLFSLKTDSISISMELYFNEDGQLIFDGYDIGKSVKKYMGDSDYEYYYTIEKEEIEKFYPLFGLALGDQPNLLKALQEKFSVNEAYSLMGQFMDAHGIEYSAFTWR